MPSRFYTPREQFFVNPVTGEPLSGGKLYFYATGTTTPLNTYSDPDLTVANTNPVILDSAGQPSNGAGASVDIFLQNLSYRVVLTDADDIPYWSADNVYTSDFSTVAVFQSYAGNPNGFVAGTAGSPGTPASVIWDYVNNILYVCISTGTAATAVWTAVNSQVSQSIFPQPTGRLTPTSLTPVISSDTTTSTVFYTPYNGNQIPIWTGGSFSTVSFSELSLTLTNTAHLANTIYDVFVFNNAGVVTIGTGPAWSVSTAGSGSRGTGAGTTQLTRLQGILTNQNLMTLVNGANTYVGQLANSCTYVGSIFIDSTPGQVTCHISYGQSRKWGIQNAYNQLPIVLRAGDPTAQWNYGATKVFGPSNSGTTADSMTVFSGIPTEFVSEFNQRAFTGQGGGVTNYQAVMQIGIGFNSTTSASGLTVSTGPQIGSGGLISPSFYMNMKAKLITPPTIGTNVLTCLDAVVSYVGTPGVSFFGTETNMLLTSSWLG